MSNVDTATQVESAAILNTETGVLKVDFGSGRYSQFMMDCYKSSMNYFGWNRQQAEKFARNAAAEIGRCVGNATIEVNRVNKKGFFTLKDAAKVKGMALTPVMSIIHILDSLEYAWKVGMDYSSKVNLRKELVDGLDLPQPSE